MIFLNPCILRYLWLLHLIFISLILIFVLFAALALNSFRDTIKLRNKVVWFSVICLATNQPLPPYFYRNYE